MQTTEKVLSFFITYLPSLIFAFIGYFFGHYLSCRRNIREKSCEFIINELDNLQHVIDESLNDIALAVSKDGFEKIVLNRQRVMNRKVEFLLKILNRYHVKSDKLKDYFDKIKEFLTGDEFSITASKSIDEPELSKLKANILCEIDDLKWETISKF